MDLVDTAAQVIIINRSLSVELGYEAPMERVQLRNAKISSCMDNGIKEGFNFQFRCEKYSCDVVEADVEETFIIRIDLLRSTERKIDLGNNVLEMGNSPFRELATRGTSTNQIAASWMLQATWLATVASRHIVWQALLISL